MKVVGAAVAIIISAFILIGELRSYKEQFAYLPPNESTESEKGNHGNYNEYWNQLNLLMQIKYNWVYGLSLAKTEDERSKLNDGYAILQNSVLTLMESNLPERKKAIAELREFIQNKIHKLQNPEDCSTVRQLVCKINGTCGFGCYTHLMVNCFIQAFELKRVFVPVQSSWGYAEGGWEHAFLPISKCKFKGDINQLPYISEVGNDVRIVKANQNQLVQFIPFTIPSGIAPTLIKLHGDPFAWWISQFVSYLMRLNPRLISEMENRRNMINFKSPVVGIQIRRGDKLKSEASFHSVEEYMFFVEQYFNRLKINNEVKNQTVYVATEDATVLPELKSKFPKYTFIVNKVLTQTLRRHDRYNEDGLSSVLHDLFFLSQCDYIVCTFSSSVCRTSYELMINREIDAPSRVHSLDMPYRLKTYSRSAWKVIMDHKANNEDEIDLRKGDQLRVSIMAFSDYSTGMFNGFNKRTKQTGLFPAIKVRPAVKTHSYAILADYKDKFLS